MLKRIRRGFMLCAIMSLLIGLALLANFTAPNPTGRRYSSEMPSRALNDFQRGLDAERILSNDLGIENNNSSDAGQCICSQQRYGPDKSPRVNNCNICVVYSPLVEHYNIPDFITDRYIIDSKDVLKLDTQNYEQLENFALMSKALNRPLWLFVSQRTKTAPYITQLVEDTGGQIVLYFSYPGYVDVVDAEARKVIFGSLAVLGLGVAWEYLARKSKRSIISPVTSPTAPKPVAKPPKDPLKDAESFVTRSMEKHRIQIDIEDSRNDLK